MKKKSSSLRVVDLFCGGGGISEGLRQAGFEIVFGLDKEKSATETFKNNQSADVAQIDIENLSLDELPEFDVLVGGPPCIEFSMSKGRRRNILAGLKLVQAFLRVVYYRRPKYWIMENVPRIAMHLPEEIPLEWLGIDKVGNLNVPIRKEFNCADFGVPQRRRRYLIGNFPLPTATHHGPQANDLFCAAYDSSNWRTLGEVLNAFPCPAGAPKKARVTDPIYNISVTETNLTDHFHEAWMSEREIRKIRRAKLDHPYMGRMAFPDRTDQPARTVVATQLGRETLVIHDARRNRTDYRRATVRECASLQGFPITYQFFGNSYGARYRIVGDAVPPPLVFRIGQEILTREGQEKPDEPIPGRKNTKLSSAPLGKPFARKRRIFRHDRKFSELIPGKEVRGCRAELDNQGSSGSTSEKCSTGHAVEWRAMLYVGEGRRNLQAKRISYPEAVALLRRGEFKFENRPQIDKFLAEIRNKVGEKVPDAISLQKAWVELDLKPASPESLVDLSAEVIERHFPKNRWKDHLILRSPADKILPSKGIRVRIVAGLVAASLIAEIANRSLEFKDRKRAE